MTCTNYVIVDRDNMKFGPASIDMITSSMIAWIDYPDVATVLLSLENKVGLSIFSRLEMLLLYKNMTGENGNIWDYNDVLNKVYVLACEIPIDERSIFELEKVSKKLEVIDLDSVRIPASPIIHRHDQAFLIEAKNLGNDIVTDSSKSASNQPSKPSPKGATGRVWEIADACIIEGGYALSDKPIINLKSFRSIIINKCVEAGINAATAATQYSKWKATK